MCSVEGADEVLTYTAADGGTRLDREVHEPVCLGRVCYGYLNEVRAFVLRA